MPLQRRVPKFGFKNINRVSYKGVNLGLIQELVERKKLKEITIELLQENGVTSKNDLVKILNKGELKTKVNITAHKFSAAAKSAVEALGGVCTEI